MICENHMKLKFQCPQMLGYNSKSNCYANFSVFTLSFFHPSLWMGNGGFLDWHWFLHYNKGPCFGLFWPWSSSGTEDPAAQGVVLTGSREPLQILDPGVPCSVIPSPCPVPMQTSSLDLSWSLCVLPGHKGHLFVVSLGWEEKGRGCGPGPTLLVPLHSGAEFWVVWKVSCNESKSVGRQNLAI